MVAAVAIGKTWGECDEMGEAWQKRDSWRSASMQGFAEPLQFTNTGSRTCTLESAPGVSYVTDAQASSL
jgi:Domain of unknown function (DUF4232)